MRVVIEAFRNGLRACITAFARMGDERCGFPRPRLPGSSSACQSAASQPCCGSFGHCHCLVGTSLNQWNLHDHWPFKSIKPPGVILSAVESSVGLSQNWFVAAIQMAFSTEQGKVETTNSIRIAAGLILGLGCFSAVLTGGIFVGQTIGEGLSMLQTIAPVEVDPLR